MPAPLRLHSLLTLAGALLLPLATTQGQALPPPSQAIAVQATPTYHHGNTEMAGYLIEEALMVCLGPEILEGVATVGGKVATRTTAALGELAVKAAKEASEFHSILTIADKARYAEEMAAFIARNESLVPALERLVLLVEAVEEGVVVAEAERVAHAGKAVQRVTFDSKRMGHIFRAAEGHVGKVRLIGEAKKAEYIALWEEVANNTKNLCRNPSGDILKSMAVQSSVVAHTQLLADGTQACVHIRQGQIVNAGINLIPLV